MTEGGVFPKYCVYAVSRILLYNWLMPQSEYNCPELAEKLKKVQTLYSEYRSAIPENRDGDFAVIKKLDESGELEKILLELEDVFRHENMLEIDRSFNLVEDFLKKPQTEGGFDLIWLDSENPIAESDIRNEGLTEIDLSKVKLDVSWLPKGKTSVHGERRLDTLKANSSEFIRLDLFVFASLWKLLKGNEEQKKEFENKLTIIAEANGMKFEDLREKVIFFDGTIIRDSDGGRYALYLRWISSKWDWNSSNLGPGWNDGSTSLVLAI
jgi:hypothetical protein